MSPRIRAILLLALAAGPAAFVVLFLMALARSSTPIWLSTNFLAAFDRTFGAWSLVPPIVSWMIVGLVGGGCIYFAVYEAYRFGWSLSTRGLLFVAPVVLAAAAAVVGPVIEFQTGGRMYLRNPGSNPFPGETRIFADMEFVWVPSGRFRMGSLPTETGRKDDEPPRIVTLTSGFWLGRYEVTQSRWKDIMGENPSYFGNQTTCPVDSVTKEECLRFIGRLNELSPHRFRLPTEAEWEYACRAGSMTAYGFGDDDSALGAHGWYAGNSHDRTHPVGEKEPNAWGFFDMHGNVAEWCADCYGTYGPGRVVDPIGPEDGELYLLRGGDWSSDAAECRCARRTVAMKGYRDYASRVGLRLVKEFAPQDSLPKDNEAERSVDAGTESK